MEGRSIPPWLTWSGEQPSCHLQRSEKSAASLCCRRLSQTRYPPPCQLDEVRTGDRNKGRWYLAGGGLIRGRVWGPGRRQVAAERSQRGRWKLVHCASRRGQGR